MEHLIRDAGFTPARRRQDYSIIPPDEVMVPTAEALAAVAA
jgi:hypothetical protein